MTDLSTYYEESYPPSIYGPGPAPVPATGATAGTPGTWTPPGSTPPASVIDLAGGVPNQVLANPQTAWTSGQFVQTATTGVGGRASWSGTDWVGGAAPLHLPQDVAGFNIADVQAWVTDNPDQADEVLAAEQARGANARVTLVDWLNNFIATRGA